MLNTNEAQYLEVRDSALHTSHFAAHDTQACNVVHSAVSHKAALLVRGC